MKSKILILSLLTILLSSCFNKTEEQKEIVSNTWTVLEEKIEENTNSWKLVENNTWATSSWELNSNSWSEAEIKEIEVGNEKTDEEKVKEMVKDTDSTKTDSTDKSIDELLKDFDEDLNIEEILWWA